MRITNLNSRLILTSGASVLSYDHNSNNDQLVELPPPLLPPSLTKGQLEVLNKQDKTINSMVISHDEKFIAVAAENKQLVIFNDNLEVMKNLILNRVASKILFTRSGDILVADRTGDVYLYKLSDEKSEPILLLGHLSMILDMVLSECEKFIITCDRDEKIRVSHYPNTYNIVSFCLGHEEFVTRVKVIDKVLFSASGDGTIRMWNYVNGEQLNSINTNEFVNDKKLLEQFSHTMDKEKVDVTALPVTDMQVYCCSNVFIAVSLYYLNAIQLYKIELENCKWSFLHKFETGDTLHTFYFTNKLYVFNNLKLLVYNFLNNTYSLDDNYQKLEQFLDKHKTIFKIIDDEYITVLYKRKFDNVQDYLERKRLRIESSK